MMRSNHGLFGLSTQFILLHTQTGFPAAICVLKCIEVWAAVSINREDDLADGKASCLPNQIGEAKAEVIATLGKRRTAPALAKLASPAIELNLMSSQSLQAARFAWMERRA